MTKYVYTVKYEILWQLYSNKSKKGRPIGDIESFDSEDQINIVGNGDAMDVIAKAKVVALKRSEPFDDVNPDNDVPTGKVYRPAEFRLIGITRGEEVHVP